MLVNATEPIFGIKAPVDTFGTYCSKVHLSIIRAVVLSVSNMIRSTSCVQSGRNRILVHSPRNYTSYRYPQPINDSIVIAVKSGLKDINSLVIINNGREKHLDYIGSINSRLSYRNGRVYWSELVPGLRWTHQNYSIIKYYE